MASKKNKERIASNPLENKNVGRRTGKDIKAGKSIRKIAGGFENFDDYWSESDADMTRDGTVRPITPAEVTTLKKGETSDAPLQPPSMVATEKQPDSVPSVLVQSQMGNIPTQSVLNPFTNKHIGRRTGKDIKTGKNIRVLDGGFENFDDYWSESDADSLASFCTTSCHKSKATSPPSMPAKAANNTSITKKMSAVSQQRSSDSRAGETSRPSMPAKAASNTSITEKMSAVSQQRSSDSRAGETSRPPMPAKAASNTSITEKNSSTSRQSSSNSRGGETSGRRENTEKSGIDPGKTAVVNAPDQEIYEDTTAPDSQTAESSSEDVDSGEKTICRDGDSQEEKDASEEDGGQGDTGTRDQDTQNEKETFQERNKEKTELKIQGSSDKRKDLEPQKESEVYDKNRNLNPRRSQREKSGSDHCTELHPDSSSNSNQPSHSSTKEIRNSLSKQRSSLAGEQSNSLAKKQMYGSGSKVQRNSAKRDSRPVNKKGCVEDGSEQGEDREEIQQDCAETETGSSIAAEQHPVSSKEIGPKSKIKGTQRNEPSISQQCLAVSQQHKSPEQVQQSMSDQNATGISQSQVSGTQSPPPASQKSSVYLSIVGDVTGSITKLGNSSVLTPEPKLYGTRRRLSYAESPGQKDQQPKAKTGTHRSRVPRSVSRTNLKKAVSSPIPEDHKESAEEPEEDLVPPSQPQHPENGPETSSRSGDDPETDFPELQSQENPPKDPTPPPSSSSQFANPEKDKIPPSQLVVAKDSLKAKQSPEQLKRTSGHQANLEPNSQVASEPSQNSLSEVGMFLSLASQTQARLKTSASVFSSDCEDYGFEIVDESKVYRAPAGQSKSVKATSGRGRNRVKKIAEKKNKEPSVEKDASLPSTKDGPQQKETSRTVSEKKTVKRSLFLTETDEGQPSADTSAHVEKKKVRRNTGSVKENQHGAALVEKESEKTGKSISKKKGQRSPNPESQEPMSADTVEERPVGTKRSRKVAGKKSSHHSVIPSSKNRLKSPATKAKQKKKTQRQPSSVFDFDEDEDSENPVEPETVHKKTTLENRFRSRNKHEGRETNEDNTTEDEPLFQETAADIKSSSPHRPTQRTKKIRTGNATKDAPVVQDTAADSEPLADPRRVQKKKKPAAEPTVHDEPPVLDSADLSQSLTSHTTKRKTRSRAKQKKPDVAEDSPAAEELTTTKRRNKSTKSKTVLSDVDSDVAEDSPAAEEQTKNKRRNTSTKPKTVSSDVDSVKPAKRGKKGSTDGVSPAKKPRRTSIAMVQEDAEHLENEAGGEELNTPSGHSIADLSPSDTALKSGISFRRFSQLPSSLQTSRSRQLIYGTPEAVEEDIISSPAFMQSSVQSSRTSPLVRKSRPAQPLDSTPLSGYLPKGKGRRNKERRVTISNVVTQHNFSPEDKKGNEEDTSVLPSMSATPVHYYQSSTPTSPENLGNKNKIVHPEGNTTGLRRSQRTRVKPIEWYKNERIIYDRRRSGPVVLGVEPSMEHIYQEHENQKRRKRRQRLLMEKKQNAGPRRLKKRLSTHVALPSNLNVTVSTDIPVIHPDSQDEVLMSCLNPAARAPEIGPNGNVPSADDPFSLRLITQQSLFTTGTLTLAPVSEKPLQRTMSTVVLYFITYGKVLVTINRATAVLETGDHFFVPRGTVYKLKNLRREEAILTFANLMVDQADTPSLGQPTT